MVSRCRLDSVIASQLKLNSSWIHLGSHFISSHRPQRKFHQNIHRHPVARIKYQREFRDQEMVYQGQRESQNGRNYQYGMG